MIWKKRIEEDLVLPELNNKKAWKMFILELLITFAIVAFVALIVNAVEDHKRNGEPHMSFKESMDLVELPIITFYNNGKKLNFLLDTGANNSIINKSVIKDLDYKECTENLDTFGIDGEVKSSMPTCTMEVKYKDNSFEDTFTILNMDSAFRQVKEDSGVQLHGILGSLFFQKYKYVIDFKSLVAYIRK